MDTTQRRFLLAIIGQALDANPRNVEWYERASNRRDLDCLHYASYDSGVQAGLLIEAKAVARLKVEKRRARKRSKARR